MRQGQAIATKGVSLVDHLTEFCVAWLLDVYTQSCWKQLFQEEDGFVGNIVLER